MKHSNLLITLSLVASIGGVLSVSGVRKIETPLKESRQNYSISVDSNGIMRRTDNGAEVSYYGTNYTVPFAHAFRALHAMNIDPKETIKNDVGQMVRLGFNAFRIHLWDAELADADGNLKNNEHLELLDYLISELEKRGIDIILTAQTNFGNGYPERDIDTGAFTYDFPKCGIHEDKKAQKIQENYLKNLVSHVNPFTGRSFADDRSIIAIEINNEPCHTGSSDDVTDYINQMVKALRKGGFDRIILYNVSHNDQVRDGFYNADIQGTTFQWYPSGLVAGHERKGNFLPAVAEYNIPWKNDMKNYDSLARVVYEFDPGDILGSYLYPAIARTFRKEGFQWITQFTYDPTPLAAYNTEYQTHYLNLLYTPSKALSMMIAGEVARELPRNSDFGPYPENNVFGDFRVDYQNDISILNSPEKFFYTNFTAEYPVNIDSLAHIAGRFSSPVVKYDGSGAYFLDKLDGKPVWRLEVMPDVDIISDPFEKPSFNKKVAELAHRNHTITVNLSALGKNFHYKGINEGNIRTGVSEDNSFSIMPGVYLLSSSDEELNDVDTECMIGNLSLTEYNVPEVEKSVDVIPLFEIPSFAKDNENVEIKVDFAGESLPDSVVIYPSDISFWRKDNNLMKMERGENNSFKGTVESNGGDKIRFKIVVFEEGKSMTYPSAIEGTPLDWDAPESDYFEIAIVKPGEPQFLFDPDEKANRHYDMSTIPTGSGYAFADKISKSPVCPQHLHIETPLGEGSTTVFRSYVGDIVNALPMAEDAEKVVFELRGDRNQLSNLSVALLDKVGATYFIELSEAASKGYVTEKENGIYTVSVPLNELVATSTFLIPEPFPSFMLRETNVKSDGVKKMNDIEFVEIRHSNRDLEKGMFDIFGIWME